MLAQGDLPQAEELLRRALQLDPAYAPALCNYGRLKQRDGSNLDMAANMLTKARLLMPNSAHILSSCALFMEEALHSEDKASEIYEESLTLHPSEHLLLNNFAQLLRTSGKDPARAAELFNRALESNPSSSESLNGLALLLSSSNKTQEAEAWLGRAMALYPHDSNTLSVAAHIKLRNNDLNASSSLFKQALQSDPANFPVAQNYAALLLRQRRHEDAICCLESAMTLHPSHPGLLRSLSHVLQVQGDLVQAVKLLSDAHSASPSDPDIAIDLSSLLVHCHQSSDGARSDNNAFFTPIPPSLPQSHLGAAEAVLRTAVDLSPHSSDLAMSLAHLMSATKDPDAAARFYAKALLADHNNTAAAVSLARSLMAAKKYDQAVVALERQALLHPRSVEVVGTLGRAMAMAEYEDAEEVLEMALELDPTDRASLVAYALVLKNEKKDYQGALAAYKTVLRLHPTDSATMCNMGVLHEEWMNDWETAIEYYRQAWLTDPGNARALFNRARVYDEELMSFEAAVDFYTQAALHARATDPRLAAESYCRAAHILGVGYNQTGKSFQMYRQAAEIDPSHPGAMRGIGAAYAANGEMAGAIKLYEKAVAASPGNAIARGELADLYHATNRVDEAEAAYLSVLEKQPGDVHALRGYATLLKHRRQQPALAAQVFLRAKEIDERAAAEERQQQEKLKELHKTTVKVQQRKEDGTLLQEDHVPLRGAP